MIVWLCDSCGEEVPYDPDSFKTTIRTSEGPVTIIFQAGYGGPQQGPQFRPETSGAVVCKKCIHLSLEAELAMEKTDEEHDERPTPPHRPDNGGYGTGR